MRLEDINKFIYFINEGLDRLVNNHKVVIPLLLSLFILYYMLGSKFWLVLGVILLSFYILYHMIVQITSIFKRKSTRTKLLADFNNLNKYQINILLRFFIKDNSFDTSDAYIKTKLSYMDIEQYHMKPLLILGFIYVSELSSRGNTYIDGTPSQWAYVRLSDNFNAIYLQIKPLIVEQLNLIQTPEKLLKQYSNFRVGQ